MYYQMCEISGGGGGGGLKCDIIFEQPLRIQTNNLTCFS